MGLTMATRIQDTLQTRSLSPLQFYNRTASRGLPLRERGALQCESISELVHKSDVIFISVRT